MASNFVFKSSGAARIVKMLPPGFSLDPATAVPRELAGPLLDPIKRATRQFERSLEREPGLAREQASIDIVEYLDMAELFEGFYDHEEPPSDSYGISAAFALRRFAVNVEVSAKGLELAGKYPEAAKQLHAIAAGYMRMCQNIAINLEAAAQGREPSMQLGHEMMGGDWRSAEPGTTIGSHRETTGTGEGSEPGGDPLRPDQEDPSHSGETGEPHREGDLHGEGGGFMR